MTRRMKECLDLIAAGIAEKGVAPSYEELKDGLGLKSKSGVHRIILALEERGQISRLPNHARAIVLGSQGFPTSKSADQDIRHALLMIRDAVNLQNNKKISAAEALRRIGAYAYGESAA